MIISSSLNPYPHEARDTFSNLSCKFGKGKVRCAKMVHVLLNKSNGDVVVASGCIVDGRYVIVVIVVVAEFPRICE
jgi:hypothetical protein